MMTRWVMVRNEQEIRFEIGTVKVMAKIFLVVLRDSVVIWYRKWDKENIV